MTSIYVYADEASRDVLQSDREKVVLIGSDLGYKNFGDVLQHVNCLRVIQKSERFATISVMATHAIGSPDFPELVRNDCDTDAIVFVADYPLILDESCPRLQLVEEIRNLSCIYLYGGGFLNNFWGDFVLGLAEYFLHLAPDATYLVSGQQITPPFQSRVVEHIRAFKPALFGVRDKLSFDCLREDGFEPHFSFDDATEALLALTENLPLQRGPGLLMHLNSSNYTSNDEVQLALCNEIGQVHNSPWSRNGITLFQAFQDVRGEVVDSRETIKKLDAQFPFCDFRSVELAPLVSCSRQAQLPRPIIGELGYSCSYHVALWLQLAGIPCWLRSSNPFYDQKARALQVTQDLEAFLREPRLADHRGNLEARARWHSLFLKHLTEIPEARNVCRIPVNDNGPAPWPFFFKGTPTLEDRLIQANKETDAWRLHADAAEAGLVESQVQVRALDERVKALGAQFTEVGNEAHKQRARAEAAEAAFGRAHAENGTLSERVASTHAHMEQLLNSRSWRITKPGRAMARYVRFGHFDSQGEVGLFALVQRIGRRLPIPQKVRQLLGRFLARFRRQR